MYISSWYSFFTEYPAVQSFHSYPDVSNMDVNGGIHVSSHMIRNSLYRFVTVIQYEKSSYFSSDTFFRSLWSSVFGTVFLLFIMYRVFLAGNMIPVTSLILMEITYIFNGNTNLSFFIFSSCLLFFDGLILPLLSRFVNTYFLFFINFIYYYCVYPMNTVFYLYFI